MTPTSSVRRQRGSVTLVFLFSMTSIMLSLLAAIDIMRYNLVQSRLQSALDAAVLAAGRNLGNLGDSPSQSSQQAWRQDAIGYLSANMPNGYLGSNYDISKVEITVSGDARAGQQIGMRATAELPLLVAGFPDHQDPATGSRQYCNATQPQRSGAGHGAGQYRFNGLGRRQRLAQQTEPAGCTEKRRQHAGRYAVQRKHPELELQHRAGSVRHDRQSPGHERQQDDTSAEEWLNVSTDVLQLGWMPGRPA
ncbi:Tad domain-containing protein [Microvirgula aerodenitrificans]|uniref:TadE/TadG family type IV pilus assembly protein n=1 Tax=Microvirgula aerodenitrificans TaxID=57480 RepID=UPI002F41D2D3